jgi:ketosteroid isomerase-like protein
MLDLFSFPSSAAPATVPIWSAHQESVFHEQPIIRDTRALTESVSFEVQDILARQSRVAIIGALETRIKATDKIIATQFAIVLTITGDVVTRYQMLEDSFDVSKAART